MKLNEGISFGIDLGVGSVGWSVLDLVSKKIIDKGVHLFGQADKAEDRRVSRSSRRRLKRKKHRMERIKEILNKNNIYFENTPEPELLEKRIIALKTQIEMQDLVNIIYYYARHRGYIPYSDKDEEKKEKRENEIIQSLKKQGLSACEIQKEILTKNNKYRGTDFSLMHEDYIKELKQILDVQSQFYNEITDEFKLKIEKVISSKRKFWEGPGGPRINQISPYGRYTSKKDIEEYKKNPNYNKYLFEKLIGNCSIYLNEKKASAFNYFAESFNFYNDFVNLRILKDQISDKNIEYVKRIDDEYCQFNSKGINKLKEIIIQEEKVILKKILKEYFGIDINYITGYKTNSKNEIEISKFETYRKVKKVVTEREFDILLENDKELYNKVIYMIQESPDVTNRFEMISQVSNGKLNEETIEVLSNIKLDNKYHKFSEKALKKYFEIMERENCNSSYAERNFKDEINSDVVQDKIDRYIIGKEKIKYISSEFIEEIVAAPAVKKSLRKAISVINKLISRFGYPEYICVETTRSLLSSDKQKEYDEKTLSNNLKRNNAKKMLEKEGYEASETNIIKYLLLKEMENKCAYCGKDITINNCEREHILPVSITGDDSFLNKTVSCHECNSTKKERSPYMYLEAKGMFKEFVDRVNKNPNIIQEKKQQLTTTKNLDKYEKNFKHRNLNDTAYATNELANQIKLFIEAYKFHNNEDLEMKILRVPGQFTHKIRENSRLEKNRDKQYHHAVDATIVANIPNLKIGRLMTIVQNEPDKYWKSLKMNEYREELIENLYVTKDLRKQLDETDYSNTRFSQEIQKHIQGKLFDANISKVIKKDDEYYKIEQIDNIYEIAPKNVKEIFDKNLLCKEKDIKLYERLKKIANDYYDEKINAFILYCIENLNEEIKLEDFNCNIHGIKRNDKENSPIIKRLRYYTKVTLPFLVDKKSINKKDSNYLMYDSVQQYCTRIYRHKETGELYFMPICRAFVDTKSWEIKKDTKYYKELYNRYVGIDEDKIEKYMDLFNNEYVKFENKDGKTGEGLVKGFDKTNNKVEIKHCNCNISKRTLKIEKLKFDILGLYNLNIM